MFASQLIRHFRKANLCQRSSVKINFSSTSSFEHKNISSDETEHPLKKVKEPLQNEKYMKLRFENFAQMKNADALYPHKYENSMSVEEFVKKFEHLQPTEIDKNQAVAISGRIFSIRSSGKHLRFLDLHQNEARVQIKADSKEYDQDFEKFEQDFDAVRRGDVVGVLGFACRTKTGELSIVPTVGGFKILSPCLRILPSGTLEKPEHRFRRRYLDLMLNPNVRQNFKARSEIIKSVRQFLDSRDFVEVETPILCSNVGGASATPFQTRHLEMDMDMFLRISPELYLKMLVIGGLDRVYELGKQFRNEGLDSTHNPEFTSCEFYMAHADYQDLMPLTEEMLKSIQVRLESKIKGGFVDDSATKVIKNSIISKSDTEFKKNVRIDFTVTPYGKIDFLESLEAATGMMFPDPEDIHREFTGQQSGDDVHSFLLDICDRQGVNVKKESSLAKLFDKLFGHFVESSLEKPTFVLHHPLCMSPLAKEHRNIPGLAERFELYANGIEIVNAYTELNDPSKQKEMFKLQRLHGGGEDEKCFGDIDNIENQNFVRALEYGLPPTAGWGLGLDRLVMLLTRQRSIRQVILFPTMKPLLMEENVNVIT